MSNCRSKHVDNHETKCCSTTALKKGMPTAFPLSGMTCNSCKKTIESVLNRVSGVESVEVDLNSNRAFLTGSFHVDGVINVTRQAGYTAELIPVSTDTELPSAKVKKSGCCCR